jgi:uncharacterized protein (DUF58 family)
MTLLPQSTIDRLALARFPVRRCVNGSRSGNHRSPFTGASSEFAQHRQYCPGDEPRRIDWRVLARTDRFMVKQYDQETNLRATILLDTSASMAYCGDAHGKTAKLSQSLVVNKLTHATRLAAALAWTLIRQGDAVGMVTYDQQVRLRLPIASTTGHLHRMLSVMSELRPQNPSATAPVIHQLAETIPARGLVILLSDLFEDPASLLHALHHLRHRHHEVVVLQVLAPEELRFPFHDTIRFRDLEATSDDYDVEPQAIRREYLRQLQDHLNEVRQLCHQVEADYWMTTSDESVEHVLTDFLASRHGSPTQQRGSP